jgi:hypothetical protein
MSTHEPCEIVDQLSLHPATISGSQITLPLEGDFSACVLLLRHS